MKVTLESTSKILTLATPDGSIPVRVWEGQTEGAGPIGTSVLVLAYIAELRSIHLNADWILKEEQGDELAHRDPSPEVLALLPPAGRSLFGRIRIDLARIASQDDLLNAIEKEVRLMTQDLLAEFARQSPTRREVLQKDHEDGRVVEAPYRE
jgi:hypothetical protein